MPPHPGLFIRTEILDAHSLSVTAAAAVLGVARPTLSNLVNGRAALTSEMALRIEMAFGVTMNTLMQMQLAFDLAHARKIAHRIRVRPYRAPQRTASS
ncbi:MAG: HigA family addiction module antitoxin [bacterium]